MSSRLMNPFSESKVEVDTAITEKKYEKGLEDGSWDDFYEEDDNEYYKLLVNKHTGFGTIVRKKFKGYTI